MGEVGGYRAGARDDRGERHAGLLTEQAYPVGRRFGAVEQQGLLVEQSVFVDGWEVGVILPVPTEGAQPALCLGVGAPGDLA